MGGRVGRAPQRVHDPHEIGLHPVNHGGSGQLHVLVDQVALAADVLPREEHAPQAKGEQGGDRRQDRTLVPFEGAQFHW